MDGAQGIQGAKGQKGEIGPQGVDGSKGDQGNKGDQGSKGNEGTAASVSISSGTNIDNRVVTMTGNSSTPFLGEGQLTFDGNDLYVNRAVDAEKYEFRNGGEIQSTGTEIRFVF